MLVGRSFPLWAPELMYLAIVYCFYEEVLNEKVGGVTIQNRLVLEGTVHRKIYNFSAYARHWAMPMHHMNF